VGTPHEKHLRTLEMFAYSTYEDFKTNKDKYIELKEPQLKKLRMITIAQFASINKVPKIPPKKTTFFPLSFKSR
jgi:hypothetical protein